MEHDVIIGMWNVVYLQRSRIDDGWWCIIVPSDVGEAEFGYRRSCGMSKYDQ